MNLPALDSVRSTKVPLGIKLVFWGLELWAVSIIMAMFLPMLISNNLQLLRPLAMTFLLMLLVANLLGLIGKALCLTAPNEMQGKSSIYAAVIFDCLALGLGIATNLVECPPFTGTVGNILSVLALFCFLFFLKALSQYIGVENLVKRSQSLLFTSLALIIFWAGTIVAAIYMPLGAALFGLVVLVLGIISLLKYSRLLAELMKVLSGKSPVT